MAKGTLVLAEKVILPRIGAKAFVLDWSCDGSGDVDQSITDLIERRDGKITAFETSPGTSGDRATKLPLASYDVEIQDEYAADVAGGSLVDRSGTLAERINPTVPIPVWSPLTLIIAAAGVSMDGRIIIVIDEQD